MYKYIIIPLVAFFIIALIIGQCNNASSDKMEEENIIYAVQADNTASEPKETPPFSDSAPPAKVDKNKTKSEKEEKTDLQNQELANREINMLSYELPRLIELQEEQILVREGYTTSYNKNTKNANWVAWHLTRDHTSGPWSRKGISYIVDEDVKGPRQELEDYNTTTLPIDHGHMCPAGDNKWSAKAMEQTFLLTNMCPQNSALNRGDWEELESRCRGWANHYGEIWIACGPIFNKGYKIIGNGVGVPDAFYKVILRTGKEPKALGFIYPNDGTHHKMTHYLLSVDDVEEITRIDFFYNLPDDIETMIEANSNLKEW